MISVVNHQAKSVFVLGWLPVHLKNLGLLVFGSLFIYSLASIDQRQQKLLVILFVCQLFARVVGEFQTLFRKNWANIHAITGKFFLYL